jgi:hypothetical protein
LIFCASERVFFHGIAPKLPFIVGFIAAVQLQLG